MPSNEGQRLCIPQTLRRAARHGRILGIEGKFFMTKLAQVVIDLPRTVIRNWKRRDMILRVIDQEEELRKRSTKDLRSLLTLKKTWKQKGTKVLLQVRMRSNFTIPYGFPIDLTKEILDDKGLTVDEEGFPRRQCRFRERLRSARKTTNYMGRDDITETRRIP